MGPGPRPLICKYSLGPYMGQGPYMGPGPRAQDLKSAAHSLQKYGGWKPAEIWGVKTCRNIGAENLLKYRGWKPTEIWHENLMKIQWKFEWKKSGRRPNYWLEADLWNRPPGSTALRGSSAGLRPLSSLFRASSLHNLTYIYYLGCFISVENRQKVSMLFASFWLL